MVSPPPRRHFYVWGPTALFALISPHVPVQKQSEEKASLEKVKKRALLLVNPKARRGGEAIDAVVARLHRGGLDVTIEPFEALPEIARDIVRLRESADLIILCGGDGTIASGALAVEECGLPLGIIPMGTANDLARTLGIPMDLSQAADVILPATPARSTSAPSTATPSSTWRASGSAPNWRRVSTRR